MSETAEAIARRLIDEGFNQGRLDVADELISPQLVEHWGVPDRLATLFQLGLVQPPGR